jgi:hypothetical protein
MNNTLCKPTITNMATLRNIEGIYKFYVHSLYQSRKFFSRIKTIKIVTYVEL